jgi:hypothetical protein
MNSTIARLDARGLVQRTAHPVKLADALPLETHGAVLHLAIESIELTAYACRRGRGIGQSIEAEEGKRVTREDEPLLFVSEIGFSDVPHGQPQYLRRIVG